MHGQVFVMFLQGSSFFDSKLKHGKIYKTHLFGNPVVRVIGENNVNCILAGENEIVTSHWPESTRLLLNGGFILENSGSIHSLKKKTVLKSLTQKALDKYGSFDVILIHHHAICNNNDMIFLHFITCCVIIAFCVVSISPACMIVYNLYKPKSRNQIVMRKPTALYESADQLRSNCVYQCLCFRNSSTI